MKSFLPAARWSAAALLALAVSTPAPGDAPYGPRRVLQSVNGGYSAYASDMDGDGDLDLLGTGFWDNDIIWFENVNGDASTWTSRPVDDNYSSPRCLVTADLDGDGDQDVISSSQFNNSVDWWENQDGVARTWKKRPVAASFMLAATVYASDIDRDGDLDIAAAAYDDMDVVWFENQGTDVWPKHLVDGSFSGAVNVYCADIDGDGHEDIIGAGWTQQEFAWWRNPGTTAGTWTKTIIGSGRDGARWVYCADIDRDGDQDVVSAARYTEEVSFWENAAGDGSAWVKHDAGVEFDNACASHAADFDLDGDIDLLGAAWVDAEVAWFETRPEDDFPKRIIEDSFLEVSSVWAGDFDRDGDQDVVGAAWVSNEVATWENLSIHRNAVFGDSASASPFAATAAPRAVDLDRDGYPDVLGADANGPVALMGDGGAGWTVEGVGVGLAGTRGVAAADIDRDGMLDVVAVSPTLGEIAWWRNDGGAPADWTMTSISNIFTGIHRVEAADVDGDGDVDLFGSTDSSGFGDVVWLTNLDGKGTDWGIEFVTSGLSGNLFIATADFDGDGDVDSASASSSSGHIEWWENSTGGWTARTVSASFAGVNSLAIADVDRDGSPDILATGSTGAAWWENPGGTSAWTKHALPGPSGAADSLRAADLDSDGDIDLVGTGQGRALWWRNDGAGAWTRMDDLDATGCRAALAADVNRDGAPDILLGGDAGYEWIANIGGQYALDAVDIAPEDTLAGGELIPVFAVTARHNGIAADSPERYDLVGVRFEDEAGAALTVPQASALVSAVRVYLDNGSGSFEPGQDQLVHSVPVNFLNDGLFQFSLPVVPETTLQPGAPRLYFVSFQVTANAGAQSPNAFRAVHVGGQDASRARDWSESRIILRREGAPDVPSKLIRTKDWSAVDGWMILGK